MPFKFNRFKDRGFFIVSLFYLDTMLEKDFAFFQIYTTLYLLLSYVFTVIQFLTFVISYNLLLLNQVITQPFVSVP